MIPAIENPVTAMARMQFEKQDLDALRKLQRASRGDLPETRGDTVHSIPTVQLNVRIRPQIKANAIDLAKRHGCTLAMLIERAIDALAVPDGGK